VDPAAPFINTWAAAAYFFARRTEEGMASLQKALELDPSYYDARIVLARTYVAKGMHEQAIAELQKALTFHTGDPGVLGALAHAHARAGDRQQALQLLDQLKQFRGATFVLLWAYAGLGDRDQAFAWLERFLRRAQTANGLAQCGPVVGPLRSDPPFADLVRRVGLPSPVAKVERQ
jgi:tetratricopeptide (TPR) repeat protein